MFSHVSVGVSDFERSFAFYDGLLPALGQRLRFHEPEVPWAAWEAPGEARPLFVIAAPLDGAPASAGNGSMIALLAPSRAAVDTAHSFAMNAGAQDEGAPGLRPHYHPDYYGAYFRDPDGNKLCVVCHDAPSGS